LFFAILISLWREHVMQKKLTRILTDLEGIAGRLEDKGLQHLANPLNDAMDKIEELRELCKALN
jgi:hypothetical protein